MEGRRGMAWLPPKVQSPGLVTAECGRTVAASGTATYTHINRIFLPVRAVGSVLVRE